MTLLCRFRFPHCEHIHKQLGNSSRRKENSIGGSGVGGPKFSQFHVVKLYGGAPPGGLVPLLRGILDLAPGVMSQTKNLQIELVNPSKV